uniref:Uncharacterized protein n=1 Tax=Oryza barthii TaxID=65489 RepID=A0A0D3G9X7_9ORYZ
MTPTKCSTLLPSCAITKSDAESIPTTLEHVFPTTMNPSTPSAASAAAVPPVSITTTKEDEADMGTVEDKSENTLHDLCVEIKEMINQMLETCRNSKVEPIVGDDSAGVAVVPCTVTDSVSIALETSQEIDANVGNNDDLVREEDCVENTAVETKLYPVLSFSDQWVDHKEKASFNMYLTCCHGQYVGSERVVVFMPLQPWPPPFRANCKSSFVEQQLEPWPFFLCNHSLIKLKLPSKEDKLNMLPEQQGGCNPWEESLENLKLQGANTLSILHPKKVVFPCQELEIHIMLIVSSVPKAAIEGLQLLSEQMLQEEQLKCEVNGIILFHEFFQLLSQALLFIENLVLEWYSCYSQQFSSAFWSFFWHLQQAINWLSLDDNEKPQFLILTIWPIHEKGGGCLSNCAYEGHEVQIILVSGVSLQEVLKTVMLKVPWQPPTLAIHGGGNWTEIELCNGHSSITNHISSGVFSEMVLKSWPPEGEKPNNQLGEQQWLCNSREDVDRSAEFVQCWITFASVLVDNMELQGTDYSLFILGPLQVVAVDQELVIQIERIGKSASETERKGLQLFGELLLQGEQLKCGVVKLSWSYFSNHSVGNTLIVALLTQTCVQLVPSYNQSLSGSKKSLIQQSSSEWTDRAMGSWYDLVRQILDGSQ